MGDTAIKFTQDELDEITTLLTVKGFRSTSCEVCNTDTWLVDDRAVSFSSAMWFRDGHVEGDVFTNHRPSVIVTCENCGNTKLFNLEQLGFKKKPHQKEGD